MDDDESDLVTDLAYAGGAFGGTLILSRAVQVIAAPHAPGLARHLAVAAGPVAILLGLGAARISRKLRPHEAELVLGAALAAAMRAAQAYAPGLGSALISPPGLSPGSGGAPRAPAPAEKKDAGVGTLNIPLEDDALDGLGDLDGDDLNFD